MICHSTNRTAVTSVVVFALITTTICCSGEGESRQKEQKNLMADVRGGQRIYIKDRQLRSLVRQSVGTGADSITDKQMAMLQEIIAAPHFTLESRVEPKPIRDLDGLEFATGLTHLDLSGHHLIDDITPNDWGHITLFNFDTYDYSPLDTLDTIDIEITYAMNHVHLLDLVQITANISDIDDLTPLAGLKNLKHLSLTVRDASEGIKPLAGLTSLETLRLSGSSDIYDLTPLAGLKNLRHLYLDDCGSRDWDENEIAPLAGLTNLETLHLNNNFIYDLTPLAGLTNLKILDLSYSALNNLTPLAGLTNLEILNLNSAGYFIGLSGIISGRLGSTLTPLAGLTNLKYLDLGGTYFEDITPLAGLTNLEWLDVQGQDYRLKDITPLAGLTNLRHLYLGGGNPDRSRIDDLTPLAKLTNLEELFLYIKDSVDVLPPLCA